MSHLNSGNALKGGGAVLGSGLALLDIVVVIGIVAEDCKGLTMSTVDHFPPIHAGWSVAKISVIAPFCSTKKRCEGTVL